MSIYRIIRCSLWLPVCNNKLEPVCVWIIASSTRMWRTSRTILRKKPLPTHFFLLPTPPISTIYIFPIQKPAWSGLIVDVPVAANTPRGKLKIVVQNRVTAVNLIGKDPTKSFLNSAASDFRARLQIIPDVVLGGSISRYGRFNQVQTDCPVWLSQTGLHLRCHPRSVLNESLSTQYLCNTHPTSVLGAFCRINATSGLPNWVIEALPSQRRFKRFILFFVVGSLLFFGSVDWFPQLWDQCSRRWLRNGTWLQNRMFTTQLLVNLLLRFLPTVRQAMSSYLQIGNSWWL